MTNAQNQQLAPIEQVRGDITKMQGEFAKALPPHIPVERFVRVVMTAIQTNPDLLKCDKKTLFSSCTKAAQDGLLPDGREAALVKYGETVAYLPMIAGILKKVRNSGDLASVTSQMVFEKDDFKFFIDDSGEHLEHRPLMFGDRGKAIGVYAIARTKDNAVYIEVMSSDQVMKVKACSRAKNGPWAGAFEHEMWRKTALRRLSKRLPMSTDLEQTIERDDELYDLSKADEASPSKAAQLTAVLTGENAKAETEVESEVHHELPADDQETPPEGWDAGGTVLK